ncbi:DUF6226 family protein [Microbacterium sp. NPDC087665]|uniref:DUF6226 family protein n=1 Tax=Microbacterium sp. NPDC087665 TaxID=3364194 RepID=UPI0038194B29
MHGYQRPLIAFREYRDDDGQVIEYGHQWSDHPSAESHERVHDPDRFEPLRLVANALIDWMLRTYDAALIRTVVTDPSAPRVLDVVPRDPTAAPLSFSLIEPSGVLITAGVLHEFRFPDCRCDACDEDIHDLAEDMEWIVKAVVDGGYSEHIDDSPSPHAEYRLHATGAQRTASARGPVRTPDRDRLAQARAALPPGGVWAAWPRRTDAA